MIGLRALSGLMFGIAATTPAAAQYYGYYAPYPYAYAPPAYEAPRVVYAPPAYVRRVYAPIPFYARPAPVSRAAVGLARPAARRPSRPAPAHAAALPVCLPPPGGPIRAPSAPAVSPESPAAAPTLTPPRAYYPPEGFQQERPAPTD